MTIEVAPTGDEHRKYHVAHLRRRRYVYPKGDRSKPMIDTISSYGGMTIAFRVCETTNKNDYPSIRVSYGLALCSNEDRFNRKDGRDKAIQRADEAFEYPFAPITSYGGFTGKGSVIIDLPPSLIQPNGELVASRFLHISILNAIMLCVGSHLRGKNTDQEIKDILQYPYDELELKV